MRLILRYITLAALFGIVISNLLLLNFTAPNPTGRRYSSEMPLTTGQGNARDIGRSGEAILAKDLRLPNNNDSGQKQCICNNTSFLPNPCAVCLVGLSSLTSPYRIPDFIGSGFIAESKNEQGLLYTGREVDQINDYALAANLMGAKLWVYVRVDTEVSPEFYRIIESTGGGVVRYFTVPGYVDPVDRAAQAVFGVSLGTLGVIGAGKLLSYRMKKSRSSVSSAKPPRPPRSPDDPVSKAIRKTTTAEEFMRRSKEKRRREIEIEDARDDMW